MKGLIRIAALGLGAGLGAQLLQPQVADLVESLGFSKDSRGGSTAANAVAAGVGIFAAEAVLKAL